VSTIALSFLIYSLAIAGLGIYSARFSRKSSSDFFLADRGLGPWVAALSSSASAESGWVTLGLVGTAFSTGIGALWIVPGTMAAFLVNWLVIARRVRRLSAERDALTLPDVLAAPHRGAGALAIRVIAVLIIISMLTAYVAAQLNAAGKTFDATFGWSYVTGVLTGSGIIVAYTIVGGFRAVAWTDVAQSALMVLSVVVLPILLVAHVGGPAAIAEKLSALDGGAALTDPLAGKAGLALLGFLTLWLGIPMGLPGQPHVLVRLMALEDETKVRRAAVISTAWVTILFTGAVVLGIAARAYYTDLADPEKVLPMAAQEFMPGAIAGLMIAAVLAAICSTADSQLLVSASAVSHDLLVRVFGRKPSERAQVLTDRAAVLLVAGAATAIAAGEVRAVFDFVLYAWSGLGAAFGPALLLTLLWKRTSAWGVVAGMVTGVATTVVWRTYKPWGVYELAPAFLLALFAVVGVSLLSKKRAQ
jgi:sodium/proline symporter